MQTTKKWWQSKTVIIGLLTAGLNISHLFGFLPNITPELLQGVTGALIGTGVVLARTSTTPIN